MDHAEGLDILRGGIDAAFQGELQRDLRRPLRAGRCHGNHAGEGR